MRCSRHKILYQAGNWTVSIVISCFLFIFIKRLAFPKVCHPFWLTEHTRLCSSILKSFENLINYFLGSHNKATLPNGVDG